MNKVHASLFSGIGGFDLAAELSGMDNAFHCEIENYQREKLKEKFRISTSYDDITKTDFTIWRGRIDILSGGFPCQDISAANFNASGIIGSRSGLWGHFSRAINEIRPKYVIIENSPQLLKKGFEKVLFDLSEIGYDAQWECISASAFGFPHERERLFVVAYPNGIGQQGPWNVFENCRYNQESRDWQTNRVVDAIQRKTLPPLCDSNYGFPERVVKNGITTLGNAALYSLGNAVVPAVVEKIIRSILMYDQANNHHHAATNIEKRLISNK